MYSFEGEFRRKPQVSLRGASKREDHAGLLQRNLLERKKREFERKRQRSALQIQQFVRGCLTRYRVKQVLRGSCDRELQSLARSKVLPDPPTMRVLLNQLLLFYTPRVDQDRLLCFSQIAIQHRSQWLKTLVASGNSWLHQMRRLLYHNSRLLLLSENATTNISTALRFIELFTDTRTYEACLSDVETVSIISRLQFFLVSKGYFVHMKTLINARLPSGMDIDHLPPLAESVENLIFRPIKHTLQNENQEKDRSIMLRYVCKDFFSEQFSDQVSNFLLPAVAGKSLLPLTDLLDALLLDSNDHQRIRLHPDLQPSAWLLYAVMSLTGPNLRSLPTSYIVKYLHILQVLLPCLPTAETQQRIDDLEDSDVEDELFMEIEELGNARSVGEIREHCLQQFNTSDYVQSFKVAADTSDVATLTALCQICHILMTDHKLHVPRNSLLCTLACNTRFLQHIWKAIGTVSTPLVTGTHLPLLHVISRGIPLSKEDTERIVPLLSVFSSLFGHLLQSLHDSEFHQSQTAASRKSLMPFTLPTLVNLSLALRNACLGIIHLAYPETRPVVMDEYFLAASSRQAPERIQMKKDFHRQCAAWLYCFKVTSQLVKQLYERDCRLSFCPEGHWLAASEIKLADLQFSSSRALKPTRLSFWSNGGREDEEEVAPMTIHDSRRMAVLAELPFMVSFEDRVKIFLSWIYSEKGEREERTLLNASHSVSIIVRRDFIYEDAFDKLRPENEPDLCKKMRVQMRNVQGLNEAGIDGGGITREFLSQLLQTAFDPNRGFFKSTADSLLYPNPQAVTIEQDFKKHYYFIGRILGKVLYENLLVELPLASFFLSKILQRHSDVDIHHLASLDPIMYKNLLSLKDYEGDVADLDLNFTVVDDNLGEAKVYELKPGGEKIQVTNANRIEYIHLMADFRLNKQIRPHILNFRAGIADVIDLEWLRMFDYRELQILISGAMVPIDVDDMRRHTNYAGEFSDTHPVIQNFWEIVKNLPDSQRRSLLKFITSCSRPPLLGFKELHPALCIHSAGKADRLPTASTCMNLLKLPHFKDKDTLKTRLLYAIESAAGFELS
ncbi:ubiquitin-protein ligase E3C-like [Apostichopus japonicus]|uniref:ubiquitin-protein ligase E3C-like n=1 Tax=Stichopus japonicus TaxID=307972 RepID=UPI003AB5D027